MARRSVIIRGVERLRASLLVILLGCAGNPALADQADARLDHLFQQLHAAPDAAHARIIEQVIWTIWIEHPDTAVSQLMRNGIAAMGRGDQRAALKSFDQVVAIAPDYAEGWNKRATVHYLLGNYEASLADIERTLALEPRHFGALSGRGLVYAALEEWDLALESFDAALAVHPQMPGAKLNADAIRHELEQHDI